VRDSQPNRLAITAAIASIVFVLVSCGWEVEPQADTGRRTSYVQAEVGPRPSPAPTPGPRLWTSVDQRRVDNDALIRFGGGDMSRAHYRNDENVAAVRKAQTAILTALRGDPSPKWGEVESMASHAGRMNDIRIEMIEYSDIPKFKPDQDTVKALLDNIINEWTGTIISPGECYANPNRPYQNTATEDMLIDMDGNGTADVELTMDHSGNVPCVPLRVTHYTVGDQITFSGTFSVAYSDLGWGGDPIHVGGFEALPSLSCSHPMWAC